MDPLSVPASLIAVIGAAGAAVKKIDRLRHADEEIKAIRGDLADFEKITAAGRDILDTTRVQIPKNLRRSFSEVLNRAQKLLVDLDNVVNRSLLRRKPDSQARASKVGPTMKSPQIAGLREQLKNVKSSLGSLPNAAALTQQLLRAACDPTPRWTSPCPRCDFVRKRKISRACLACLRLGLRATLSISLSARVNFADIKLTASGTTPEHSCWQTLLVQIVCPELFSRDLTDTYQWLDDSILCWEDEEIAIHIFGRSNDYDTADDPAPALDCRIRRFAPAEKFNGVVKT
ncbi:uncharacterized protein Z519_07526 [Cladophialophora bantiana CBS 173.52]|uniref:Fungal N-terminal domain-containing protein n=1 Tax=Cladophialophora bantiana (strain ATCC 10958 / CBS 173.52 / CDC B-1940 / NIH 8579) TaxID=1442370 RepID=A0A0D2I3V1_CLAB1|nr:uncharacterized protein Z519_07526 [Cladophialophora bantiana CBS 173.52]KIW91559.1 hypothetical protein Z519_07526 [Cladophialophora bantiana CBS 173.52]